MMKNDLNYDDEYQSQLLKICLASVDHIGSMIAYWDKDQICRFANSAYYTWFGKTRDEMINKMSLEQLLGPELYQKNLPYILSALKGEKQNFERIISLPDASIKYSEANYYPDIENGIVNGFVANINDISYHKKLEFELIKHEEELKKSLDIISDQNAKLLNFTHLLTHNLRNHANNFTYLIDMLEDISIEQIEDINKNDIFGLLNKNAKSFNDTLNFLNNLIDIQSGKNIECININLFLFTNSIIKLLDHQIKNSDAIINNKIDQDININFSPIYLESILQNLISNAIKYRDNNRKLEIRINTKISEKYVILEILDNGIGIDLDKYSNKLFGMYQTFHANQDNNINSKGIGLFISKYQIEALGGKIEVESQLGVGTKFILYFPI